MDPGFERVGCRWNPVFIGLARAGRGGRGGTWGSAGDSPAGRAAGAWPGRSVTIASVLLSLEEIRAAPKVLLHDHLDGGLRPATIIDLARESGYGSLPSTDVEELSGWLTGAARRGKLELYL